ncbi:GNAT family N-acetyltransferase [Chelativorans salis]|uniref:GNAT family N-acetyltransferase n=1 Tax=Chelativorans salis TaxID=2978478 RepID=A0ABT2LMB5_9HYPH|nr:GNAT family N-acetyltransferase [Chelativorans sp. EGI FJ00035]MCT7375436.1 GNAT family N-acetyltransferase [Chelativorans sp. EGI FJ00035]
MFLRSAGERDLKAVRALLVETWHATYDSIYGTERVAEITDDWHSLPSLKARLERLDSEFVLVDDGREIIGMAFASAIDKGETVMLHQLYVKPAHQGKGVGSLLLGEVESCFPDARRIRLEVEEANVQATAFYRAKGFSKVGTTADCGKEGSGIGAAVLERPTAL